MKRAGFATLAIWLLAGFTCPDDAVSLLVLLPMGTHHYDETDANFLLTLQREVFVVGDTATQAVLGRRGHANVGLDRTMLRFSSSAPAVATVSGTGLVTAQSVGEARILVRYASLSDTVRVVVVPSAAELRLVLDPATIRVGATSTLRATAYDASGAAFPRTYFGTAVGSPAVADVHLGPATISGDGPGTASVTARLIGQALEARTTITVTP